MGQALGAKTFRKLALRHVLGRVWGNIASSRRTFSSTLRRCGVQEGARTQRTLGMGSEAWAANGTGPGSQTPPSTTSLSVTALGGLSCARPAQGPAQTARISGLSAADGSRMPTPPSSWQKLIHLWPEVDLAGSNGVARAVGFHPIVSLDNLWRIFGTSLPHQAEGKI